MSKTPFKNIVKWKTSSLFKNGHFGQTGFEIMAKKWPKWGFYGEKIAILCPIGLKIGFPIMITLDRNDGQNKLEGCISKNMALLDFTKLSS